MLQFGSQNVIIRVTIFVEVSEMRKGLLTALAMVMAVSALVFSSQAENVSVRGDYVEVRTASVFAGACHYNGEIVTPDATR